MSDSSHQREINEHILRALQELAIQSSCYSQALMVNLEVLRIMIYDTSKVTKDE